MSDEEYGVRRASVKNVFYGERCYVIPPYQRDYAWDDENAIRLWEDLSSMYDKSKDASASSNLLGAMVILKVSTGGQETDMERQIVDGQQRLATLSMIFAAIRAYMHRFDDMKDEGLRLTIMKAVEKLDGFLSIKDEMKITLGETDKKLFKKLVANKDSGIDDFCNRMKDEFGEDGKLETSHDNLIKNYKLLFNKIEDWAKDNGASANSAPGESIASIHMMERLVESISEKNHFAYIEVHKISIAYKIFKTFNSTGQKLSQADLIKSMLIANLDPDKKRQDDVKKEWDGIFKGVEDPDMLLYESLQAQHALGNIKAAEAKITTDGLFHIIEENCKTRDQIERYVDELRKDADILKKMDEPADIRQPKALRSHLYGIDFLRARYIRIPILVAWRKWGDSSGEHLQDLVACLLTFFFKFKFINDGSIDEVRRITRETSKKIAKEESFAGIISHILVNTDGERPRMRIDEGYFRERFQEKMFKISPKQAKYILAAFETHLRKGANEFEHFDQDFELEHILPKNHNQWGEIEFFKGYRGPNRNIEKYKDRLGNLTLLTDKWNRGLGNKPFDKKKNHQKGYANSAFEINKNYLREYTEWTAKNLADRERRLCDLARDTWSLSSYDQYLQEAGFSGVK